MAERIRHASIYDDAGKKIATATNNSYGADSGDEAQVADDGYFGHSDGATMSNLSFDTIEPVRETDSKNIVAGMLNKRTFRFSVGPIAGEIHEVELRCKSYKFDSDPSAGTLKGNFVFEGGEPKTTGITL